MTPEQRKANQARAVNELLITPEQEAKIWDKAIERQYLHMGGFCERCGEACEPYTKPLPQEFRDTACPYNGEHPDCGNHQLEFEGRTAIGEYEIWTCVNNNCDYQEAL